MGLAVYNAVPMVLTDGKTEHRFTLKLNPSTDSFRLESESIKRSVFIGRRMFNKLFQIIRNEYGTIMGRIQYSGNDMRRGSALTSENEEFQFEVFEGHNVEVIIRKNDTPAKRVHIVISNTSENKREKEVRQSALIPSVFAALIFSIEAKLIA
jgi:hypothetical protein